MIYTSIDIHVQTSSKFQNGSDIYHFAVMNFIENVCCITCTFVNNENQKISFVPILTIEFQIVYSLFNIWTIYIWKYFPLKLLRTGLDKQK